MEKKNFPDSFMLYIKREDIYVDISKDVEIRFVTWKKWEKTKKLFNQWKISSVKK